MNGNLKIYCDGGARGNPGSSASSFVAIRHGKIIFKSSKFLGKTTNNVAEYNAVLMALVWLLEEGPDIENSSIFLYLDSELVFKQLRGDYKIKSSNLKPLAMKVKALESKLKKNINFILIPRNQNSLADTLVNKEMDANI